MIDRRQSRHGGPTHANQGHRPVAKAVVPQQQASNPRERDPPREPGDHAQSRQNEHLNQRSREKAIVGAAIPDTDRDAQGGCQAAAREPNWAAMQRRGLRKLLGKIPRPGRKPAHVTALVCQKRQVTAMRIDKRKPRPVHGRRHDHRQEPPAPGRRAPPIRRLATIGEEPNCRTQGDNDT